MSGPEHVKSIVSRVVSEAAPRAASSRAQLLLRMGDLQWHHGEDLAKFAGIRYGARLLELKQRGYVIEERGPDAGGWKSYRLAMRMPFGAHQGERARIYIDVADLEVMVNSGSVPASAAPLLEAALARAKEKQNG
jgi:hypothetical protein